jgi:hypothetical protein
MRFPKEVFMKTLGTLFLRIGLLFFLSSLPLVAQVDYGLNFTTSFPFYAGNTRMPAGSYRISPSRMDESPLTITSSDGKHSAFIPCIQTQREQYHPQSAVTFHKYGDTEYLNLFWVRGEYYGMKVIPTKAEQKAAETKTAVVHSITATTLGEDVAWHPRKLKAASPRLPVS